MSLKDALFLTRKHYRNSLLRNHSCNIGEKETLMYSFRLLKVTMGLLKQQKRMLEIVLEDGKEIIHIHKNVKHVVMLQME